jgi:hypothetical protein
VILSDFFHGKVAMPRRDINGNHNIKELLARELSSEDSEESHAGGSRDFFPYLCT